MFGNRFELNEQTLSVIRELGDHMPGGFFIYQAEKPEELLYANSPVFEIFGCRSHEEFLEMTGNTFRGMVHPDDYERISDSIHEQIKDSDDHMDYTEYRIIRKDGAVRWVDDYGHFVETDKYGGVFTVFISDITEKKEKIQSHIAGHEAKIEALHRSFQEANALKLTFNRVAQALAGDYFSIYIVDPDTDEFAEYSSTERYEQLGIEKSGKDFFNVSRKNMARVIYPEDKERFMAVFKKERIMEILERDGSFTTKYRLMFGDEPVYVSMKATLMEDEDGRHLIFGTNNIDAQMKREAEFQARMTDARNQARNDFLANMSHDIRTPMNAIVGYTNIANTHTDDPQVIRDCLDKIGSSSHFLLSLINDVLDMSKIESGKMQLTTDECDLEVILGRIEDITLLQARKKSLHISYDRARIYHPHVLGDELRIEQILINIISNAIKYTPEGKDVVLIAEELGVTEDGFGRFRFIIRDTGIGISEEYLPHIFDSFTREQNTTINRIQGTGLGLSITAKLVEQMGGKIEVSSRPGEGSEFTVTLDLELIEKKEQEEADEEDSALADLTGKLILLVEDNDINAEIAAMILSQYGIETERAENGQTGVEMVQQKGVGGYDAILMDIQMPVMNGYEATRAIRAMDGDYYHRIPIIAMSANAYDEDVRRCLDSGMNAHVAKPFKPEELFALLAEYLRKH